MRLKMAGTLLAAALMAGCVASDHPFPEENRERADARGALTGGWEEIGSRPRRTMEIAAVDGRYVATLADEGTQGTQVYDADVYRAGDETFAALRKRGSEKPFFILVKYTLHDGTLTLWNLSDAALKRAISEGRLTAHPEEDMDDVLTSEPADILRAFSGRPESDLSLNSRYRRVS